ncbi:hypothetical protein QE152_g1237 [Popillia japonica]|uniref:Uncharacterized protein n=1 Tax=Popillia japonica TaxID=7064 RepID=A0AAW1N3C9_POPJA
MNFRGETLSGEWVSIERVNSETSYWSGGAASDLIGGPQGPGSNLSIKIYTGLGSYCLQEIYRIIEVIIESSGRMLGVSSIICLFSNDNIEYYVE